MHSRHSLFFFQPLPISLPYTPLAPGSAYPEARVDLSTSLASSEAPIASHCPDPPSYPPDNSQNSLASPSFSSRPPAVETQYLATDAPPFLPNLAPSSFY